VKNVNPDDLADLVRAAGDWGLQEANDFYGRRNSKVAARKKVIWWYSHITGMTLKNAEKDLRDRSLFA
jgi:hypothetical protein